MSLTFNDKNRRLPAKAAFVGGCLMRWKKKKRGGLRTTRCSDLKRSEACAQKRWARFFFTPWTITSLSSKILIVIFFLFKKKNPTRKKCICEICLREDAPELYFISSEAERGISLPLPPSSPFLPPPVDSVIRCVHLIGETHLVTTRSFSEQTFPLLLLLFLSFFSISFSLRRGIRVQEPVIIWY